MSAIDMNAFWYKNGKIKQVNNKHINDIIGNPEAFGFTLAQIKGVYEKNKEPLGSEGKSREQIMVKAMKDGWIRVRQRSDKSGKIWIIQFDNFIKQKKDLKGLIEYLLYSNEEMKKDDTVYFSDVNGKFSQEYSSWEGNPITTFCENRKSEVKLVEDYREIYLDISQR